MSYDVKEIISIDLDVAIEADINSWNEYLCELVAEPTLQDIEWEIVGLSMDNEVVLEVTGYVDEEPEDEEAPDDHNSKVKV